jgi:hypothetical protein
MSRYLIPIISALLALLPANAQESSSGTVVPGASSAFLPRMGQSTRYEYSDTLTTQKKTRRFTAALTLASLTAKQIRASIAINGKESRTVDFYVDDTGMLQPMSLPEPERQSTNKRHSRDQSEEADALRAFTSRVALASRIAAQPTQETSFRVKLTVLGASCPLNPTLVLKPVQPEMFVADVNDTTSVSAPQANRRVFIPLGLGIGAGFIGGAIGGTPGRLIGVSISATALVVTVLRSHHSGPLPTDVSLHIDGEMADRRIQRLSGDQEVIVHARKHTQTISDKWSFVAA